MNHRFLLRLVTNLAVFLLTLACFGIVLWVIDEFLMWDILPDAWSLLIRALLVAAGIIAFVLVVMNLLLSLALMAEANASRASLPDYGVSARLKRRVRRGIVIGTFAIALTIGGLQITNHFRERAATQLASENFYQTQADMNQSMSQVLPLFTPPLLEGLENNTLAEQGQLGNTAKLFNAIKTSFSHTPLTTVLVPANQAPYKYASIDSNSIRSNNAGKTILSPELYTTFPNEQESQAIEQLFAGNLPTIEQPLAGKVLDNTLPSSWGILKRDGKIIAVVSLKTDRYGSPDPYLSPAYPNSSAAKTPFHHNGPDELLSN
ncbi:MAG: hypothetical protein WBD47_00390 [Phormidesmis sp.]